MRQNAAGDVDPRTVIPPFRVKYVPRKTKLSPAQFSALLAALNPKHRLWVMIAGYLGARDSEVDGLRWEHIDWARGWVHLHGTKTGASDREVPLPSQLADYLDDLKR
ncbi:MAG: tyrosine-type recombinase/integrase, partial [Burkholderiales bacterium]